MGKGNKKVPSSASKSTNEKKVKVCVNADGYLSKNPVWRFTRLDRDLEQWSISKCDDIFSEIIEKLRDFEGMTWSSINKMTHGRNGKSKNHFIDIENMEKTAQTRANELNLNVDQLYSLRLTGTQRLFGIIENGVFSIIWYDKNHEVCKSHKKNT